MTDLTLRERIIAAIERRTLAGRIFSTSNCVYTGMPLSKYELMLDFWRKKGIIHDKN